MSDVNDSNINDAVSLQSEVPKGTNNSMTSIWLLQALVKWITPPIRPHNLATFIVWFFSGNFRTGTEYLFAIKQRLEPLIPIFFKSNGEVTFADEDGKTILHLCILHMHNYDRASNYDKKHDNILVTTLCKWGAPIIANDCKNSSPLKIALMKRRMDLVKTLVRFGYTESFNSLGQNILNVLISEYSRHKTDHRQQNKIIKDLICKRADFNKPNIDGVTSIHIAAKSLNFKLLTMFEKHGADLHSRTSTGDDLLILVCQNIVKQTSKSKALQLINWLLDQGFNVNSKDNNNFTPLHYASQSHQLAVVKTLVEAGADLQAVAYDGTTCLHSATISDNFEIMQYLIGRGVKANSPDKVYGLTLIHMATFSYNQKIFEYLIKNGFDSNDNGYYDYSLLHLASMAGNAKVIKRLIERGANVNSKDKICYHTALHFASMGGQFATIQKMNAVRLNLDNIDDNLSLVGSSFTRLRLQNTSDADYESTIVALLEAGANVNARGSCNCAPLHYAMRQPNSNLVDILLKAGAHVDVQDNRYFTPLHYSLLRNKDQELKYLLMLGADINDIEHPYEEIHEELRKSNYSVKSRVLRHLIKLKVANLPVNRVFRQYFYDGASEKYYIEYFGELKKLKEQMIASDVSLYDLLHMNFRCRVKFLNSLPSDLETKFPYYYILINGKCNEAINRNQLIGPAKIAFQTLTGLQWPDLCVEHILSFLNNSTLRVLIDSDIKQTLQLTKINVEKC